MRRAFERALEQVRSALDLEQVIEAVRTGHLNAGLDALRDAARPALNTIRGGIAEAVQLAGAAYMRTEVPKFLQVEFSIGLPEAAEVMKTLDLSILPELSKGMEDGFRQAMRMGLELGQNPRETAVMARQFVGFTEYDVRIIQSFELQLRGDPARVLGRTLRDHRFDGTVQKAIDGKALTESQISTMRSAYVQRLHNWRAETWSRSTTLDAARQSQLAAWKQIAVDSVVPADRFVKTWITTLDGRERDEHHAMHGTTIPLDELYNVDGGVMVPGQNAFNCRCTQAVRILPAVESRRFDFLSSPSRQPLGEPA